MLITAVPVLLALAIHLPPAGPPRPISTPEALAVPIKLTKPPQATCDLGRSPLSAPATISIPGHYYLVNDVIAETGSAITIQASHVVLDLNGHKVASAVEFAYPTISILNGSDDVTIRNGFIEGGWSTLRYVSSSGRGRLQLHDVSTFSSFTPDWDGGGISIDGAANVTILGCTIESGGNTPLTIAGSFELTLKDSQIRKSSWGTVVSLTGARGGTIEGNSLWVACRERFVGSGLSISGTGGTSIMGNTITANHGPCSQTGTGVTIGPSPTPELPTANLILNNTISGFDDGALAVQTDGNIIRGNTFAGGSGIYIGGSQNVFENNMATAMWYGVLGVGGSNNRIQGNILRGAYGVYVNGNHNLIDGNQIQSNAYLALSISGASNVYRNNLLGGAGVEDTGTGTVDAGGNIP